MAFKHAIALTGGIATGKSTVAEIFIGYGFTIIDADKIAHEILDREHAKIATMFGKKYVEGSKVVRKVLGTLIFSNPEEKVRLEALLHPLIFLEIERQSKIEDSVARPYLVDIPLFFEGGRYPIEKSIVVYISKDLQLKRLVKRDGSTKEEAVKRIDAQHSIEEKREKATYLIDNSGDLKSLQQQCARVKDGLIKFYKEK